jgi:hypothetical protein
MLQRTEAHIVDTREEWAGVSPRAYVAVPSATGNPIRPCGHEESGQASLPVLTSLYPRPQATGSGPVDRLQSRGGCSGDGGGGADYWQMRVNTNCPRTTVAVGYCIQNPLPSSVKSIRIRTRQICGSATGCFKK